MEYIDTVGICIFSVELLAQQLFDTVMSSEWHGCNHCHKYCQMF